MDTFTVGDSWNTQTALSWCSATDNVDGSIACQIDDLAVNPSVAGTYRVSYTATDSSNNVTTKDIYITFEPNPDSEGIILTGYYSSASGLSDQSLIIALRSILNSTYSGKNYDYATNALKDTDQDPNNPNQIVEFYTGDLISNVWSPSTSWNKEHVWPQSLLGISAGGVNAASDPHNLKPSYYNINSSRGNKFYDTVLTTDSYYPTRTAIHGDIARMLFYMVIMYDIYSLVNTKPVVNEMGKLDTLLLWHIQDPVDEFEMRRNDRIQFHQGNRNPFIDYPELLNYLNIAQA